MLELFYKGKPATEVPEYSEIELRLTNSGPATLEDVAIWLGSAKLREGLSLRPASSFAMPYNVGDLGGELTFAAGQFGPENPVKVIVTPQKLTLDDLNWIKVARLPTLLARLTAPNVLSLQYDDPEEERSFTYVSADFTAIKLRYFSRLFLHEETGLINTLLNRLHFVLPEQPRREEGFVGGGVRWNQTVQGWLNRPAETGLVHQRVEAPRDYTTPANRLFLFFVRELSQELRKLARLVREGVPASATLKQGWSELENLAETLQNHPALQSPLLRAVETSLSGNFNPRSEQESSAIERSCQDAPNSAYERLLAAWKEYSSRYVRLPENEEELAQVGLQPTSKIYELWAACEVASALDLNFESEPGLESAVFVGQGMKLYYNQSVAGGWYSSGRRNPPRPDLRLILPDGSTVFLDVKYRNFTNNRAHPDDMYRMLAYMNDFSVTRGSIIFPGEPGLPSIKIVDKIVDKVVEQPNASTGQNQRLAELALRPPAANQFSDWQSALKMSLDELLDIG